MDAAAIQSKVRTYANYVGTFTLCSPIPVVNALKKFQNWKLLFDNSSTGIFQLIAMTRMPQESVVEWMQVSPPACSGRKPLGSRNSSTRSV